MTDTETTAPQPEQAAADAATETAEQMSSGLRQVYLFALGFPGALAGGVGRVFREAVKQGEAIEPQGPEAFKKVAAGVGKAADTSVRRTRDAVKDLGGRVRAGASKGAGALEQRLAARLEKAGMPTRDQLQQLSDRVESLAAQVAELKARRED